MSTFMCHISCDVQGLKLGYFDIVSCVGLKTVLNDGISTHCARILASFCSEIFHDGRIVSMVGPENCMFH
jgi:hypothetical protein